MTPENLPEYSIRSTIFYGRLWSTHNRLYPAA